MADRPDTVQQGADWQGVPQPVANLAVPGEMHNEALRYNAAHPPQPVVSGIPRVVSSSLLTFIPSHSIQMSHTCMCIRM